MTLTVGDLFCGAGGFAEGFRQAGFEIRWAVDNWRPAVETFENNQGIEVIDDDVLDLEIGRLEEVDVIIGSPPCTYFSLANKGGRGDKEKGWELVVRFLEILGELRPKYWIMENVPQFRASFEEEIENGEVRVGDKEIPVPRREILTASEFGTPQKRQRLFSGSFPLPVHSNPRTIPDNLTMGSILNNLPHPCEDNRPGYDQRVRDPLYPSVSLRNEDLRDHFEDRRVHLGREEVQRCLEEKEAHRVYGKMAFPDPLDRPSRTVTATRTRSSRSTIVVTCPNHSANTGYRTLTIRECASLQGFPLVYQFWGGTASQKDRLVGNAVPPPLARALAEAILTEEGRGPPPKPIISTPGVLPPILRIPPPRKPRYPLRRRFRRYVRTEWSPDCRVELDNGGSSPLTHPLTREPHLVRWTARLYLGYAKQYRCYEVDHGDALRILSLVKAGPHIDLRLTSNLLSILESSEEEFRGNLPDASSLQAIWTQRTDAHPTPREVIADVGKIVETHLPQDSWSDVSLQKGIYSEVLEELYLEGGVNADSRPPRDMAARTFGSLLSLTVACREINEGKKWLERNPSSLSWKTGEGEEVVDVG